MSSINRYSHILTSIGLFLLITTTYLVLAIYYPVAYTWATYEDLYGEWTQVFLFLSILGGSIWLMLRGESRFRLFFTLLAAACFYTVMEEISWGQRLFGFDSPYFFEQYNIQSETNLHNFLTGPNGGTLKDVVEYALAVALTAYGLIYPLLLKFGRGIATQAQALGIPAPPLYLWPFFATAASLEIELFHFNEAEVAEILVGTGLLIMVLHYIIDHQHSAREKHGLDALQSRQLALATVTGFLLVVSLAVATTRLMYNDPLMRIRIDNRIDRGLLKFAHRFENSGAWDKAATLYLRVLESRPQDQNVLRQLTRSYQLAGNEEKFQAYNKVLLQQAEKRFAAQTDSVSVALSFSYSYKKSGDLEKSNRYALRALHIAARDAEKNPESADAAYWLGRTNDHLGKFAEGLLHYQRAHELDPKSLKFKRAMVNSKHRQASQIQSQ